MRVGERARRLLGQNGVAIKQNHPRLEVLLGLVLWIGGGIEQRDERDLVSPDETLSDGGGFRDNLPC
jgi:hypothetical protein